jgi:hypothetical protein
MNNYLKMAEKAYYWSVGGLLMATGILKLISLLMQSAYLSSSDPLFFVFSRRAMMGAVAIFEIFIAACLWLSADAMRRWMLVCWITMVFIAYRIGLWLIDYHGPCYCLGGAMDWLLGDFRIQNRITTWILWYFAGGGLLLGVSMVCKIRKI